MSDSDRFCLRPPDFTRELTTASVIVRKIKETWHNNDRTETEIIEAYSKMTLLIVDEVGVGYNSDTEKMFITEIINNRYENCLPTILMTNLTVSGLTTAIGDRAVSRVAEGGVVCFDWEDFRLG